jgi:hypothetical protein
MRTSLALVVLLLSACGDSGSSGPDADLGPDTTGETFTITIDPINVPSGAENTMCVEKRLGNVDEKLIGKLHTSLQGVSHHLIVYRVNSTEERVEPFPCTPFLDTLNPEVGSPLMVSQIHEETLDLPYGVAFRIDAEQMVRLEMHFVNPTDFDDTVSAEVVFEVLPAEQFQAEAGFLFVGNPDIDLPPGPGVLGPTWFPMPPELADVKVFGMTGHTHQWGTNMQVEHLLSEQATATPVYDFPQWLWNEPPVALFKPPLELPAGAGFRFTCSWDNQSGANVGFGESAEDEMCFFWAYYYPSQGHKVCVHTDQVGAGVDLCCPGPDPLCALINDYFMNN